MNPDQNFGGPVPPPKVKPVKLGGGGTGSPKPLTDRLCVSVQQYYSSYQVLLILVYSYVHCNTSILLCTAIINCDKLNLELNYIKNYPLT